MGNKGYKILLIEDNKLDQMAFKQMVEKSEFSYDCTIAGSVSQARDILDSADFDIIIADYSLPDGTAIDVMDAANDTPIILVTGSGDEETAVRTWKAGAYDYLIKDPAQNYLKAVPITIENAIRHKKMEDQLHLLSHAIMSTDDSIYITDMDDKIIFVNEAFCQTYGYRQEEIIGKGSDILWGETESSTDTRNICQDISGWETGFYHKRKNGRKFSISLSISGVKGENDNNIAIVGVVRDISERILVENELRKENVRLRKMTVEK